MRLKSKKVKSKRVMKSIIMMTSRKSPKAKSSRERKMTSMTILKRLTPSARRRITQKRVKMAITLMMAMAQKEGHRLPLGLRPIEKRRGLSEGRGQSPETRQVPLVIIAT